MARARAAAGRVALGARNGVGTASLPTNAIGGASVPRKAPMAWSAVRAIAKTCGRRELPRAQLRQRLQSWSSQALLHQPSARLERHSQRVRLPATGGHPLFDEPERNRARGIRSRRHGTGVKGVGDIRLLIDLFLFVEVVAERVARPLQAQRQTRLAIEDRSAGQAGK